MDRYVSWPCLEYKNGGKKSVNWEYLRHNAGHDTLEACPNILHRVGEPRSLCVPGL